MNKFFNIFGKVSFVVLIVGSILYGGYYFGKQTNNTEKPQASKTENTKIPETDGNTNETPPTPVPQTITTAGVSKNVGLSFDQYTITAPDDWTTKKESQTAMDEKLTLTNGGYSISIFQAATGGAVCLYPGDADFEGPSSKFEVFKMLTTKDGRVMRRSGDKNGTAFTLCQKSADGSFQQPTNYGHISVKIPATWDYLVLDEIDAIISSLKKI